MRRIIKENVVDEQDKDVRMLVEAVHTLSSRVDLLTHQNEGLQQHIRHQKKHKKKRKTLDLKEYYGGLNMWTPTKVAASQERRQAYDREILEQQLQKSERKKIRAANKLYNEKIAQEKREVAALAKAARVKKKAERAAEKQQQKEARNAAKAIQLSQKGKRKASTVPIQKQKRQKRVGDDAGGDIDAQVLPTTPPITTSRGRNIKLPSKFR